MKERNEKLHHKVARIGDELLADLRNRKIFLEVSGKDRLKVSGKMTAELKETIRAKKKILIAALSPKCKNCGLAMD